MAKKKPKTAKKQTKSSSKRPASSGDSDDHLKKLQTLLGKEKAEKKVKEFLLSLDEKQRSKLGPHSAKWFRKLNKDSWLSDGEGNYRRNPLFGSAQMALLCNCGFAEIGKAGIWSLPSNDVVVEVLKKRKPKWCNDLIDVALKSSAYWQAWGLSRALVQAKLAKRPDNPRYYTAMISGLCAAVVRGKQSTAYEALKADPSLLKHEVWKLFEYEGDGENTLANTARYESFDWSGALIKLAKEGELSRAKLLKSTLDALELGFNNYRSRWFFDFFDALNPTSAELKKHASKIMELIDSPTASTSQWAFAKLKYFVDKGIVKESSRIAAAIEPLMLSKKKNVVTDALEMLEVAATNNKGLSVVVCRTAATALGHEKVAVQKAALKTIVAIGDPANEEITEAVARYLPIVAASLKTKVSAWLGESIGATDEPAKKSFKSDSHSITHEQFSEFDKRHCDLFCVEELFTIIDNPIANSAIPAATFNGTEFPRLEDDARLEPIGNMEELLEACGRVIENTDLIDEAEQVLAGLTRLASEKPDNFDKLVAPIHKRAKQFINRGLGPFCEESLIADVCGLICAWARDEKVTVKATKDEWKNPCLEICGIDDEPFETWSRQEFATSFLTERSLEIGQRFRDESYELLSAPTHRGGWIDPIELVRRFNNLNALPDEFDLMLSLLRLAPGRKKAALKKFKPKIKGEYANALKYALGGVVNKVGKSPGVWACAARARNPVDDDKKIAKAFPDLGSGGGLRPDFQVTYGYCKNFQGKEMLEANILPKVPAKLAGKKGDESLLRFFSAQTISDASIQWLAHGWPVSQDAYFAAGAFCLMGNLGWWEARWQNRYYLEPLLNSDQPLGSMALFLLLMGLCCKEPGEHGLATDIAIQCISDGRLGSDNFAALLTEHLPPEIVNLTRLCGRLHEIANVSKLHGFVVWRALNETLPSMAEKRRGLGDLLELMHELACGLVCKPDDSVLEFCNSIKGSSKKSKAAKALALVDLQQLDVAEIARAALEGRLERLKIWAARQAGGFVKA